MPTRTVKNHHDVINRVSGRDFIEKHLRALAIEAEQDQSIKLAGVNIHRRKRIGVLTGEHRGADRADRLECPSVAHIIDAAKARPILEHQPDGRTQRPLGLEGFERFGEFF